MLIDINPSTLLFTILNFIVLIVVLKIVFFDKVKAIMAQREEFINKQLDDAEEETQKARMLAIENERLLKNAKAEGQLITEKHKQKAEKIFEEIVADANKEAETIIERAKTEIAREKEKVEYQLRKEAIELALELSKKVIEKNIDEQKNRELIGQFITKVGNS